MLMNIWQFLLLNWQGVHPMSVPHPDVFWYCLIGMATQKSVLKKVLVTLFHIYFTQKLNEI